MQSGWACAKTLRLRPPPPFAGGAYWIWAVRVGDAVEDQLATHSLAPAARSFASASGKPNDPRKV